jgi:glucose 1-dehydrogenase
MLREIAPSAKRKLESMKLKDKISLITGAGQGIGKAIALEFAKEGAKIVVNDLSSNMNEESGVNKAVEVAKSINASGGNAIFVEADVSQEGEVINMIGEVIKNFGRIDILVNNAGVNIETLFVDLSEEVWQRIIKTNLEGTFLCSQITARKMIKQGGGKIINISSVHQFLPKRNIAHYAASKGGMLMLTKVMALELAEHKINVNCIAPGAIKTSMNKVLLDDPRLEAEMNSKIPWGRMGEPEEVAKVALFLASEDSDYITGSTIVIDGGLSLGQL